MDAHFTEWLNLSIRWLHLITGIAWIGASLYFVWLENNLDRRNPRDGLAGELWAIHGGGIYHLEKYRLAPPCMPERLHWFKWEAYFTWLSGVALLLVVYYLNPSLYLIKPGVDLAPAAAIVIGASALLAGYLVYHLLCDSPLGQRPALLGAVLFVLLIAATYAFSLIFSGRAAYIHVGAIIGSIMVGNVFYAIMPAQRALVRAIASHTTPDPHLPARALLRSRHNNYFTLPVLFIMISNHFPSTYASPYNWLILAAIAGIGVLLRHYFNTRHASQRFAWALPAAALGMLCLAYVSTARQPATGVDSAAEVRASSEFAQVQQVIHARCSVCHSANPSSPLFSSAPAGVLLDNAAQMQAQAAHIHAQSVATQAMPLGNITSMTQVERELLGRWIARGARLD